MAAGCSFRGSEAELSTAGGAVAPLTSTTVESFYWSTAVQHMSCVPAGLGSAHGS